MRGRGLIIDVKALPAPMGGSAISPPRSVVVIDLRGVVDGPPEVGQAVAVSTTVTSTDDQVEKLQDRLKKAQGQAADALERLKITEALRSKSEALIATQREAVDTVESRIAEAREAAKLQIDEARQETEAVRGDLDIARAVLHEAGFRQRSGGVWERTAPAPVPRPDPAPSETPAPPSLSAVPAPVEPTRWSQLEVDED